MVDTCPTCGSITTRPLFTTRKQSIYDYLLKNGVCTTDEIKRAVYGPHPPDSNIISVHLNQMRETLTANGLKIVSCRGPGATYKIVEVKVRTNAPT